MLLTVHARSLRSMLVGKGRKKPELPLMELPEFVRSSLGLHGINLPTDILAGSTRESLLRLRDAADKAGCSLLLLSEDEPLPIGAEDLDEAEAAVERAVKVVRAANVLGASSASIGLKPVGGDPDEAFEMTVDRLKQVVDHAERQEVNLLLAPNAPGSGGLIETTEQTTELVKRVGGFRIGTLPSFEVAMMTDDPETYMRRLTPYASVVLATTVAFAEPAEPETDEGLTPEERMLEAMLADTIVEHTAYDLLPLVRAVAAVGYDGTLAIDYRGEEDPVLGVMNSRSALEAAFERLAGE